MIRHTILFKLNATVSKREIERVFTNILTLTDKLEGVTAITGGTCHFHEAREQVFSHGISIDFDNKISRDAFINNPMAESVKEHIVSITEGGHAGIIGFDFRE